MKHAFLSYARTDLEHAERLYRDLKAAGANIWFDRVDLQPGIEWRPAIRKAIREAKYFVPVLSKQSVNRAGFRHSELREALEISKEFPPGKVYLVPVRLDECPIPFPGVAAIQCADLFLGWKAGVAQLAKSLGARKRQGKPTGRKRPTGVLEYEYRVALVDLDVGLTNLPEIARAFNQTQRFFHFAVSQLELPKRAASLIERTPHLRIDRLPQSFYQERANIPTDSIICFTRRFIAFEEKGELNFNYLGADSPADERFSFLSLRGLFEQAKEADVKFEVALAFLTIGDIAVYFGGVYHEEIRGCPLDWTENHADLVKGLARGRFCPACARQLRVNRRLYTALTAMLAWGRKRRKN
jgi:TIR domain